MIRTEASVSTKVLDNGALRAHLVIDLSASNPGWSLEGQLVIRGLDAAVIDKVEDELTRRLGGRCTLSLGSPEVDDVLVGTDPHRALLMFCKNWGLDAGLLALKSGITIETIKKVFEGREMRASTRKRLAVTLNRITQNPTIGEFLRHRRLLGGYTLENTASKLGVCASLVGSWERGSREVPSYYQKRLIDIYLLKEDIWAEGSSLNLMNTTEDVHAPIWGDLSKQQLIEEGVAVNG